MQRDGRPTTRTFLYHRANLCLRCGIACTTASRCRPPAQGPRTQLANLFLVDRRLDSEEPKHSYSLHEPVFIPCPRRLTRSRESLYRLYSSEIAVITIPTRSGAMLLGI